MKKFYTYLGTLFTLGIFSLSRFKFVQAITFDEGGKIQGSTQLGTLSPTSVTLNIINIVLGLLSLIAVALIIYSGIMWMTSAGNSDRIEKAKEILFAAVVGLLIVLAAYGITKYVFDNIVKVTN